MSENLENLEHLSDEAVEQVSGGAMGTSEETRFFKKSGILSDRSNIAGSEDPQVKSAKKNNGEISQIIGPIIY